VEGEWATIGITDTDMNWGDVVFVELPKPGAKIETGKSVWHGGVGKGGQRILAPVAGEVIEPMANFRITRENQ